MKLEWELLEHGAQCVWVSHLSHGKSLRSLCNKNKYTLQVKICVGIFKASIYLIQRVSHITVENITD